jgi:hypothetical protein
MFSESNTEEANTSVPKSLKKVSLGNGVKNIASYAFKNCTELTSISLPEDVVSIGDSIFEGCERLEYTEFGNAYYLGNSSNPYLFLVKTKDKEITSYSVNASTRFILDEAFSGCALLEEIELNDKITTICNRAFADCTSLQSIIMPNSMENMGTGVFENCESLKYNKDSGGLYLGNDTNPYLMLVESRPIDGIIYYTVNENTKFILDKAFANIKFAFPLTIPEGVSYIGSLAFENCKDSSIIISEGVSIIKADAFGGCEGITVCCKALTEKPAGWDENWIPSNCSVIWNYKELSLSPV